MKNKEMASEKIELLRAEIERQKKINENQRVIITNQREKLKQIVNRKS